MNNSPGAICPGFKDLIIPFQSEEQQTVGIANRCFHLRYSPGVRAFVPPDKALRFRDGAADIHF